jgi:hypothetical protein
MVIAMAAFIDMSTLQIYFAVHGLKPRSMCFQKSGGSRGVRLSTVQVLATTSVLNESVMRAFAADCLRLHVVISRI